MRCFIAILAVLCAVSLNSGTLGPDVSVYKGKQLKWEGGNYNFAVISGSLLEKKNMTIPDDKRADSCGGTSSGYNWIWNYKNIVQAFLVWTAAVAPDKLNDSTDNSVTLSFKTSDTAVPITYEVTASRAAKLYDAQDFEFEGFKTDDSRGFFTYRVDITNFITQIDKLGNYLGGTFSLSGLDCTDAKIYYDTNSMAADWAIIIIFESINSVVNDLYIYNGLMPLHNETKTLVFNTREFGYEVTQMDFSLKASAGDYSITGNTGTLEETIAIMGKTVNPVLAEINNCSSAGTGNIFNGNCGNSYGVDAIGFELSSYYGFNNISEMFPYNYDKFMLDISTADDFVMLNFLIFSTDAKAPLERFDIPSDTTNPNGREKTACTSSQIKDNFCEHSFFYYSIKIQNWGLDNAKNVTVQDTLPAEVEYVKDTTEIATKFDKIGLGTDWKKIPDDEQGNFPLSKPYKVADVMAPCDYQSKQCADTFLFRFKVLPQPGMPSNTIIANQALITAEGENSYNTNSGVPMRLRDDFSCQNFLIDFTACGGPASYPDEQNSDADALPDEGAKISQDADKNISLIRHGSGCACGIII